MSKPVQFTAPSDGTRIMLDRTTVRAVYVETVESVKPSFGFTPAVPAVEREPNTVILGDNFRFTVSESYDDVVNALWPGWERTP